MQGFRDSDIIICANNLIIRTNSEVAATVTWTSTKCGNFYSFENKVFCLALRY